MTNSPLRVLAVDDSVDTARMMKLLLKQGGHEARTAFDGEQAIVVALSFMPDAVLLDLSLPDMSGTEVAKRLKELPGLSACVLVAVTGYDAAALDSPTPFEHHFTKPVDHEALATFLSGIRDISAPSNLQIKFSACDR